MFLLDDLAMLPIRGLVALCRELQEQADAEQEAEKVSARDQLIGLYMQLETGQITQVEFDASEARLMSLIEDLSPPGEVPVQKARSPRTRRPASRRPAPVETSGERK